MRSRALVVGRSMGPSNFTRREPESSICLTFQSLLIWELSLVETFRAPVLTLFHFPVVVVGSCKSTVFYPTSAPIIVYYFPYIT